MGVAAGTPLPLPWPQEQPGSPSRTFPHLMDISVFCGTAADLGTILRAITGPCFTPSLRSLELSVNPWWLGFNTLEQVRQRASYGTH